MAERFTGRLGSRGFRLPIVEPSTPAPEVATTSFGDLVRMVGESIADAQNALDRASADLLVELADQKVDLVGSITETIAPDGTVTVQQGPTREVSLLELGVLPTFYAFSEATVEVAMDLKIVETSSASETGKKRYGLFAGTADIRAERKLSRDVHVSSKLTAKLVPVPAPIRLEPVRTVVPPPPGP